MTGPLAKTVTAAHDAAAMPRLQRKSFGAPDEVRRLPNARIDVVRLDETPVALFVFEPVLIPDTFDRPEGPSLLIELSRKRRMIFASASVPSTVPTLKSLPSTRLPSTIEKA